MQPHYTHDCANCRLLGAVAGPKGPVDLYRCDAYTVRDEQTFVARFSSDGPDVIALSFSVDYWDTYCKLAMQIDEALNP